VELEFSLETKRSNQAVSSSVLDYKIKSKRPSKRRLETPRNGYSIVIPSAPALVSPATLDGTLYNSKQMQMEGGGAYCRRSRTTKNVAGAKGTWYLGHTFLALQRKVEKTSR
jgi:hypothetical protein